jgi:hypothetical protein
MDRSTSIEGGACRHGLLLSAPAQAFPPSAHCYHLALTHPLKRASLPPPSLQVGASEAALLGKLGVKPFKYGLEVLKVYENGSLFDVAVLDITDAGGWCRLLILCDIPPRRACH